jgi:hypothetical protein
MKEKELIELLESITDKLQDNGIDVKGFTPIPGTCLNSITPIVSR